jgi:GH35 family endo-1,4-beta-xylanase
MTSKPLYPSFRAQFATRACVWLSSAMMLSVLAMTLGCGSTQQQGPVSSISVEGLVHGGQQPVGGASIQLYAAGTGGVGSAAQPLLAKPAISGSDGGFSLTGLYTCPSPTAEVYIVAQGGDPMGSSGVSNSAIALMTMLGPCGGLTANTYISINEVTTIASIWPVASYMTSVTAMGSAANDPAFPAAVSLVQELVNTGSGLAPGAVPNGYVAQTEKLHNLADVIASCVNSAGGTAGDGTACGNLFSYTKDQNGNAPTNTVDAALRIAKNPASNISQIFNLTFPTSPFQPTLLAIPSDWNLGLLPVPPAPTISPASGNYPAGQQVTLSPGISGAVIHYTVDGSTPTATSPTYTSPFTPKSTETVRALEVVAGISSSVSSATFTISLSHLIFTTVPANPIAGVTLTPAPEVEVLDGSGNLLTNATSIVTLSLASANGATLSGTTTVAAANGVAIFPNLSINAAGSFIFSATSSGMSAVVSPAFNVTLPTLTVSVPDASIYATSTLTGTLALSVPPAKALTVTLVSTSPSAVTASSSVVIPAGQNSALFTYTGMATGSSTLNVIAAGYSTASVQLTTLATPTTLQQAATQRGLLVGAAVDADEFGYPDPLVLEPIYASTLATQYSMVEPEVAMTWVALHPAENTYSFQPGDEIVSFAEAHKQQVRGHTLVWYAANPAWLNTLASTASPQEMSNTLQNHIQTVMTHYKGKVFAWNVVNEAIADNATGVGTQMIDSIWYNQPGIGLAGTGYVEQAFRWARAADPNALLFYNEFNIESPGPKFDAMMNMLKDFVARGVPIDGVGFEMHVAANGLPTAAGLAQNMQAVAALGLQVHITEMDVQLPVNSAGVASASDLQAEAATYQRVLTVCIQNPSCTAFQTWGFTDKHSWVPIYIPGYGAALPFDMNYQPKPAFTSMMNALINTTRN